MKHMKKLIAAFLTLTVAFSPCVATVQAAPKVPKSKIFYLYPKGDIRHSNTLDLHISGVSDSKDVTNIKSSNPKISFKIKFNAYKTKITLKKYVNTVKYI